MSPSRVPAAPKSSKVEQILDRCEELFAAFGFKRVSMDEVVHRLGMSKKTLYQLVPNKDALVEAFISRITQRRQRTLIDLLDSSPDAIAATAKFLELLQQEGARMSPAIWLDLQRHWPHLMDKVNDARRNIIKAYVERLADGDPGYLRPGLHPKALAYIIDVIVINIGNPRAQAEIGAPPPEVLSTFIHMLLEGILNEEGRQRLAALRKQG